MPMTPLMKVDKLHKGFGSVHAVRGVSFSVLEGECFGLLGPNGAGKSTTIEMMENILPPSAGDVTYRGEPLGARFRAEAGIAFQHTALQDHLTVRDNLILFRQLYDDGATLPKLIELCALGPILGRDARKLSGGQRQRLLLAMALVNNPKIVFLDEPTTGLDPQARRNFWELAKAIRAEGVTILLTTHYMDEAFELCDRIAIMDEGQIIAKGTPQSLLATTFSERIVRLPLAAVGALEMPCHTQVVGDQVELLTSDLDALIDHLRQHDVSLADLNIRARNLEDLFIHLTGKELRE